MIPFSLYIKEYFWSYDQKYYKFSLYFSSLNLKYLKFTNMELNLFCDETLQILLLTKIQDEFGLVGWFHNNNNKILVVE